MRVRYEYPTEYIYQYTVNNNVTTRRYTRPLDIKGTTSLMEDTYGKGNVDIRLIAKVKNGCVYHITR